MMDSSPLPPPALESADSDNWDQKNWTWSPYKMEAKRIPHRNSKPRSRPRASRGPLICQVENCNNDLSQLKAYHRRYKICRHHLKVKSIVKDGIPQRFCQQCGRFHDIQEFDGQKRSCRPRLKRHNERRRKKPRNARPRPESARSGITSSSLTVDSKIDAGEESCLFEDDYADPSPLESSIFSSSTQHPYYPSLPTRVYRQGLVSTLQGESVNSRANDLRTDSPSETTVSDPLVEVHRSFTQNCDPTEFLRSIESNEELMPTIPEVRPLRQSTGAPLTMPLAPHVFLGQPLMDPIVFLPPERTNSKPMNCQREALDNLPWNSPCQSLGPRSSSHASDSDTLNLGRTPPQPQPPPPPPPLPVAIDSTLQEEERLALYDNILKLTSLSVKVFSCTPRSLPPKLRYNLLQAVRGGMVPEGYMRRGCVNLTFDIFKPNMKEALLLEDVVQRLFASTDSAFWRNIRMLVQLESHSLHVSSGKIIRRTSLAKNRDMYPDIQEISPICLLKTRLFQRFMIKGACLSVGDKLAVHCRVRGKFLNAIVAPGSNNGEMGTYCFTIADQLPTGSIKVEISRNGLIDQTLTILCVDEENIEKEILTSCRDLKGKENFLTELGLLIEFRSWLTSILTRNHLSIDRLRFFLQQSVRSHLHDCRFSFKRCRPTELNCLLISAQRLYQYCDNQKLYCTKDYLRPLVCLAVGNVPLERTLTSILDDLCTFIAQYKYFKSSINLLHRMTGGSKNRIKLVT